ncbi:HAD family hydrolase [Floccifex sp.]|uniref:HAD family hydrolase n=1 Tax=Floccifex sp. TaxID=2815810 RepID=UPI002A749B90|nr:HAD family hydrolase [Floccifex sp.]MDD7281208.1 HAD family hydrolase [Erysipelotrichaceae bacterium]MDY2958254.1 HAD family hydrolase [Floccifex sp.]
MKILALDLDGTTLNDQNKISKENIQAIELAKTQGVLVVVSTGRSLDMIPACLKGLVSYVISSNGAVIYDFSTNEKIYEKTISNELALSFIHSLPKFYFSANIDGKMVLQKGLIGTIYQSLRQNNKTKFLKVNSIELYLKQTNKNVECFQMYTLFKRIHKQLLNVLSHFPSLCEANTNAPENRYTEIFASGTNKGKALLALVEYLKLEDVKIYCIGDGQNDLELFEVADISMAVANAHRQCKEKADVIVPTNNDNGVCFGIEHYVLEH